MDCYRRVDVSDQDLGLLGNVQDSAYDVVAFLRMVFFAVSVWRVVAFTLAVLIVPDPKALDALVAMYSGYSGFDFAHAWITTARCQSRGFYW